MPQKIEAIDMVEVTMIAVTMIEVTMIEVTMVAVTMVIVLAHRAKKLALRANNLESGSGGA